MIKIYTVCFDYLVLCELSIVIFRKYTLVYVYVWSKEKKAALSGPHIGLFARPLVDHK
jgi:hypothetical protein